MARSSKSPSKTELWELYYSGDVQGVGFRATTRNLASGLAVTGYVMNLPDGRVKLVAEGQASELRLLRETIAQRMSGNIRKTTLDFRPPTGQYDIFAIRY